MDDVRRRNIARHHDEFWASYIRLGYVILACESAASVVYFLLTPSGGHRTVLIEIASLATVASLGTLLSVRHIAVKPWRVEFSLASSLLAGAVLALCVHLDGGLSSPLTYLVVLPVINAALALPAWGVTLCGIAAVLEVGVLALTDSHVMSFRHDLLILCAFILGVVVLTIASGVDRSRLQSKEEMLLSDLIRLAETDEVTGCRNHRGYTLGLEREIDRSLRYGTHLSLILADIDLFKTFNDVNGHAEGDVALAAVASVLIENGRRSDTVARIGGDEFAIILADADRDQATRVAERILRTVEERDIGISLSLGTATLDRTEPTAKRLFRDADKALYQAKARGRRCVVAWAGPQLSDDVADETHEEEVTGPAEPEDKKRFEERLREAERRTSEVLCVLDVLESTAPVGLGYVDRDFRILRVNQMLATVNGSPIEDQLGRTVQEVVPALWPQMEPSYRRVLETGEAVTLDEVMGETAADPGQVHCWTTNLYPIQLGGDVIGIGVVLIDVTDRKKLEEHQRSLTHSMVRALGAAIEIRDPYTSGHLKRVSDIAADIAAEIGCEPEVIDDIALAARIHDLGKVAIPTEILVRPGEIRATEKALVQEHSQIGHDLLQSVNFSGAVPEMILQHHERLDGSGYPNHLRGDEIVIGARVIAVADVVEAMASRRPYRAALDLEVALKEIKAGRGTLFDPAVVDACLRLAREGRLRVGD